MRDVLHILIFQENNNQKKPLLTGLTGIPYEK